MIILKIKLSSGDSNSSAEHDVAKVLTRPELVIVPMTHLDGKVRSRHECKGRVERRDSEGGDVEGHGDHKRHHRAGLIEDAGVGDGQQAVGEGPGEAKPRHKVFDRPRALWWGTYSALPMNTRS